MFLRQSSKGSNYSILGEMVFTISFPGTEYSYNHVLKELFFNYTSEKNGRYTERHQNPLGFLS